MDVGSPPTSRSGVSMDTGDSPPRADASNMMIERGQRDEDLPVFRGFLLLSDGVTLDLD